MGDFSHIHPFMDIPQEIVICEACKKEEANRFATLTRDDIPEYKAEAKLCTDCGEQFLKWLYETHGEGTYEDFIR